MDAMATGRKIGIWGPWGWAGAAFCAMWAAAIVMFPIVKHDMAGFAPIFVGLAIGLAILHPRVRGWAWQRLAAAPAGRFLAVVIAVGLLLRLLTLVAAPDTLASDSTIYHDRAVGLLAGAGYGHTAFQAPGQPFLLAAWYLLTGASPLAGYLLGIMLGTAAIPLAYDVGRRSLSPVAARWAAILMAVMPTLVFTAARVDTSPVLVLIVLAAADLAIIAQAPGWRGCLVAVGLGALLGFGSLVKPVFLPAPLLLLVCWLGIGMGRGVVVRLLLCTAAMVCVVAPWTVRNYEVLGAFVPVSTNGGYVLFHGTNPESGGLWSLNAELEAEDEVVRDRTRSADAFRWIREHPMEMAVLATRKQAYMWGTSSTNIATSMSDRVPAGMRLKAEAAIKGLVNCGWAALCVLCLWATLTTPVWRSPALRLLVLLVFMTFFMHLFYEVQSRYHIPLIGALVLVAAAGLGARPAAFAGAGAGACAGAAGAGGGADEDS